MQSFSGNLHQTKNKGSQIWESALALVTGSRTECVLQRSPLKMPFDTAIHSKEVLLLRMASYPFPILYDCSRSQALPLLCSQADQRKMQKSFELPASLVWRCILRTGGTSCTNASDQRNADAQLFFDCLFFCKINGNQI